MIPDSPAVLAGQALLAGFPGTSPPPVLEQAASRGELGGWVLFARNLGSPAQITELTRRLAGAHPADLPPWIAVDQEGGRVQRLRAPVLQLPPMRRLGQIDDPGLTASAAELLGRQLRLLGFNLDFAPVVDVDSNPDNPVIGDRSFGADPALVSRHGFAFARGLEAAGVAACAKHFPGHGDTALDSHLALPRLVHDRERLARVELAPFRALARHVATVMTAHVCFDAIDPALPATLSRDVVTGLLRDELGFGGVVFSDDLEMRAVADRWGVARAACLAIEAGCDAVLVCADTDRVLEAHAALLRRAQSEPAFEARLREACARSLAARRRFPLSPCASEDVSEALAALGPGALEARFA